MGKAVLRFGDIELVCIKCLSAIAPKKNERAASRLKFGQRVDLLIKHLEARPTSDEHLLAILNGMKRAKGLAKTRNLIAHNPVLLDIYVTQDETESFASHAITSIRSEQDTLDLEGLHEFADEIESLSSELWLAFLNFAQTSEHLVRRHK